MKAWRRGAVVAGLTLLVAGTGHEVVTGKEHWPFSPYPMFSHVETADRVERWRLVGVTADGTRHPLRDAAELAPLGEARLRAAFRRLEDDPSARARALADVAGRYEERRRAGDHGGPRLDALVLERWTWRLDPGGDTPVELLARRPVAYHPSPEGPAGGTAPTAGAGGTEGEADARRRGGGTP